MGQIDRPSGEEQTTDEVAEGYRNLVPKPPVIDTDVGAHHHSCGDHEHVDDGVFEALREEQHHRAPYGEHLAGQRRRRERHHHREAHQPVAQYRLDENRNHPSLPMGRVGDRLRLGDGNDLGADRGHLKAAHHRRRDCEQRRVGHATKHVSDENPAPIDDNGAPAASRVSLDRGARQQREAAGKKLRAKQNDETQSEWKDDRAHDGQPGLHGGGHRHARRHGEIGAGQGAPP